MSEREMKNISILELKGYLLQHENSRPHAIPQPLSSVFVPQGCQSLEILLQSFVIEVKAAGGQQPINE